MNRSILSPVLTLNRYNMLYQDHIFDFEKGHGGKGHGGKGHGGKGADIANILIKWFVCMHGLRDIFDVPKKATKIQFRAYSEPGYGRTKMKFTASKYPCGATDTTVYINGHGDEIMVNETSDSIKKLSKGRKTWYVNVYYWE